MVLNPILVGLPGMLAVLAGNPAQAQYGSRFIANDVPKVQFFSPAPDTPVAPVIVPGNQQGPAPAPQAQPAPQAPAPAARPAAPHHASTPSAGGSAAPFFVPGQPVRPASNATAAADPAAVAESFYRTYLQIRAPGIPNAAQRARLRPFLSPALEAGLAAAEQAEQAYRVRTKGDASALVEGDLFASLAEGADSFKVQDCSERPAGMQCHLQLVHVDDASKQRVEWRDTLLMVRIGGTWRIDDIVFGGKFAFGQYGQLSETLRIVIKESKEQ